MNYWNPNSPSVVHLPDLPARNILHWTCFVNLSLVHSRWFLSDQVTPAPKCTHHLPAITSGNFPGPWASTFLHFWQSGHVYLKVDVHPISHPFWFPTVCQNCLASKPTSLLHRNLFRPGRACRACRISNTSSAMAASIPPLACSFQLEGRSLRQEHQTWSGQESSMLFLLPLYLTSNMKHWDLYLTQYQVCLKSLLNCFAFVTILHFSKLWQFEFILEWITEMKEKKLFFFSSI